jgi:glycosyltransferase involved in cell wall biosynthesis
VNRTTKLDVVHPCYNPHEGWEKELLHYYKIFVSQLPSQVEVKLYLVDDGSIRGVTEAHLQYLRENIPAFEYVTYSQNRGKGFALRTAIAKTQGDLIIYTDADYPYRMENAWEMFRLLNDENYDVVLGVRDDHYYSQLPFLRKIFSLSLRTMNHIFFPSMFVKDTQSGLKGFNQKGKTYFSKLISTRFYLIWSLWYWRHVVKIYAWPKYKYTCVMELVFTNELENDKTRTTEFSKYF